MDSDNDVSIVVNYVDDDQNICFVNPVSVFPCESILDDSNY
jgi:hypothetical protein